MIPVKHPVSGNLFADPAVNIELAQLGYSVVDVCPAGEVKLVRELSGEMLRNYHHDPGRFFNFGQLDDFGMRNQSAELISKYVLPWFRVLLKQEEVLLYAGTHLVKPPGGRSGFDPHQDNTMVDETRSRSYIIWMPLVEVTPENGAVCVLPKSHRLGNMYRSVSIPWVFGAVKDEIVKHSIPVFLKAGQALVFDSALIHHSLPNRSGETRLAVNSMAIGKNSPIIKCIYRKHWLKKYIDIYEVGMDYYLNQPNEEKPISGFRRVDSVIYREKVIGQGEFSRLLAELDQDQ